MILINLPIPEQRSKNRKFCQIDFRIQQKTVSCMSKSPSTSPSLHYNLCLPHMRWRMNKSFEFPLQIDHNVAHWFPLHFYEHSWICQTNNLSDFVDGTIDPKMLIIVNIYLCIWNQVHFHLQCLQNCCYLVLMKEKERSMIDKFQLSALWTDLVTPFRRNICERV